jgi:hypothetical protein
MRHIIEIPDEIEQALEKRDCETGDDVAHIIEMAVAAFVRNGAQAPSRRRPDSPLEAVEVVAPRDLPRSASHLIAIEKSSQRMPDRMAEPA